MGRSVLLIANPTAGFAPADSRAAEAARHLDRLGFRTELTWTAGRGDAEKVARGAAGSFDLVIAAGGDGTIHEAANGLAGSPTPLGIVPLGSMNLLARELGVPLEVRGACEWIARAPAGPITLGWRDGRYFVLMAGLGYDAFALEQALARATAAQRKVRFTDYAIAATLDASRYEFPRIRIESAQWSGEGAFAFVANCARYGINFRIAPGANVEDGGLDLVVLPDGGLARRLVYFAALLARRLSAVKGVVTQRVELVTFRCDDGSRVPCQLDGEVAAPLPAVIKAVPNALQMLRMDGGR